ncbi:MAG: hypothetical protein V4662_08730 [Verrucomicrobiota bacterium]
MKRWSSRSLAIAAIVVMHLVFQASTVFAAPAPMLEAREKLEEVAVLLQKTDVKNPARIQNSLSIKLGEALTNLEGVKKGKGSALPSAMREVKAAQAVLAEGAGAPQKAKALEAVQKAIHHITVGWQNRGNK